MKKITTIYLLAFLMVLSTVSQVYSKGRKPPEPVDTSIESRIASHFNLEKSLVISIKNMGYIDEDIIRILLIHVTSEIPVLQITKLHKQGTKWEDITNRYEIDADVFNKETINILIYLGMIEKTEPTEDNVINDILTPSSEQ